MAVRDLFDTTLQMIDFIRGADGKNMLFLWTLVLMLACGMSCGLSPRTAPQTQGSESEVIKISENNKYQLEAIFSGQDVEVGGRTVKVINSVKIRSKATGREVSYARADGPSSSNADAYFVNVWSPDEEFLVLPLDLFAGFCINRASDALESIRKQQCADFVRTSVLNGPSLGHRFDSWAGNASFVFKAGLHGDETRLQYEIPSGRLIALDSRLTNIEGENHTGKIAVTHVFSK